MLLVGLGNPGTKYAGNRHNIGFMAIEAIASIVDAKWESSAKLDSQLASFSFQAQKVLLLKPKTFMNLSGKPVALCKNYYNLTNSKILVMHDELELDLGVIKYKESGGHGGHNGLRSLNEQIGIDYHRLRLGIDRPVHKTQVSDYVLSDFTIDELTIRDAMIAKITNNLELILSQDYNGLTKQLI